MAFRRRVRRVRFRRRVRRPVRRRVRRGMGAMAKRFFKLRRVVTITQTANQPVYHSFNDNPSLSQDWVSVSALFQMYRVNGLKLTFIPTSNTREFASASTPQFTPIYIVHDTNNTITSIPTEDKMLQYEGLRKKT